MRQGNISHSPAVASQFRSSDAPAISGVHRPIAYIDISMLAWLVSPLTFFAWAPCLFDSLLGLLRRETTVVFRRFWCVCCSLQESSSLECFVYVVQCMTAFSRHPFRWTLNKSSLRSFILNAQRTHRALSVAWDATRPQKTNKKKKHCKLPPQMLNC